MTLINLEISSTTYDQNPQHNFHKLRLVQKILLLYVFIILFILSCSLLNLLYPFVMERIFRDDVGFVAFVCFVAIQGSLETENEFEISKTGSQFYLKFLVYIFDLVFIICSRVRSSFVIFGCIFTLIQLGLLYSSILQGHFGKAMKVKLPSFGMILISVNILSLSFIIGKDYLPTGFAVDAVKIGMISGVMMFYVNIMLAKKFQGIMEKTDKIEEQNVFYAGFKLIRPLARALLGKFNKIGKMKIK